MPRVTPDTVDHVARLAHLTLTAEERDAFARQLDEVLAHAESIQELDTSAVEPMSRASAAGVLRSDEPGRSLDREPVLASAPDADAGLFRVPRVIGG